MDKALEQVYEEALGLAPASRIILAGRLLETISEGGPETDWDTEIERRRLEWDSGLVEGIDADVMIREARALIRK